MKIQIRNKKAPTSVPQSGNVRQQIALKNSSFGTPLLSTWAKILSRNSATNTVDLELQSGIELRKVDVRSNERAGAGASSYGERDLPPKDSIVLVIFPDGLIENALVLCSSLDLLGTVGQKQKADLLVSSKETEHLRRREGGLVETYDKSTGAHKLESNGATVKINADGSIEVTPATGKDIKLAGGATIGANDLVTCIFSGAPHCLDALKKVKVP